MFDCVLLPVPSNDDRCIRRLQESDAAIGRERAALQTLLAEYRQIAQAYTAMTRRLQGEADRVDALTADRDEAYK